MLDKIFNTVKLTVPQYTNEDKKILNDLKNDKRLCGISPICINILFNRGLKNVEDIRKFLYSTMKDTYSPMLLKDSEIFVSSVIEALENNEDITIYADYDADGVTSCSIMLLGLKKVKETLNSKSNINYYTNNRFIEGYGITPKGVDNLLEKHPNTKLIITTDNGIVGFDGINRAVDKGLKVIVTDHHEQGETLPDKAIAIINPKRKDCTYPFKGLCGAGVAFKLIQFICWELNIDKAFVNDLLDILAVGTVGDLVPLIDENRIFVKEGIKLIKNEKRKAFAKLREALEITSIDEETFGFVYAPLLNALGRITGSPDDGIELFTTTDECRMEEIITKLVEINNYRKELTKEQVELALSITEKFTSVPNVIVLTHPDFHEGVIGLVATKIRDKYQRPTIILAEHDKGIIQEDGTIVNTTILKGSARSIDGLNIKVSFDNVKDTLLSYGGHSMSAGLSLEKAQFDNFNKAINNYADKILTPEQYKKVVLIDLPLSAKEINVELIQDIQSLKPYGMSFRKPTFGLKDFSLNRNLNQKVYIGKDLTHIRLVSNEGLSLIMFNGSDRYRYLNEPTTIKAIGVPVLNNYNGNVYPQFMVDSELLFRV